MFCDIVKQQIKKFKSMLFFLKYCRKYLNELSTNTYLEKKTFQIQPVSHNIQNNICLDVGLDHLYIKLLSKKKFMQA